jgi:hypothetical protein
LEATIAPLDLIITEHGDERRIVLSFGADGTHNPCSAVSVRKLQYDDCVTFAVSCDPRDTFPSITS